MNETKKLIKSIPPLFEVRRLDGQVIVVDHRDRVLYIHLRKGPFLSAGRKLGWFRENSSGSIKTLGLGINTSILNLANFKDWRIRVFVGNKFDRCYETHPSMFFEFQKSFENKYRIGTTELLLLPWNDLYFETIKDFPQEVLKYFKLSQ